MGLQGVVIGSLFLASIYYSTKGHPSALWNILAILVIIAGVVVHDYPTPEMRELVDPRTLFHYLFALGLLLLTVGGLRSLRYKTASVKKKQ